MISQSNPTIQTPLLREQIAVTATLFGILPLEKKILKTTNFQIAWFIVDNYNLMEQLI